MKVKLSDSIKNPKTLRMLLASHGITITERSSVIFIPRGKPIPENGIVVVYDPSDMDALHQFLDAMARGAGTSNQELITGRKKEGYSIIKITHILYFMADGNHVYGRTIQDKFQINKKLFEIEEELSVNYFIRINKSHVMNIRWIEEIIPWFGGRLLLKCKDTSEKLEVSRNYVQSFKAKLGM